jgi:hypothetical protein
MSTRNGGAQIVPARRSLTNTVAASRMGGASSAANELPRIVPPGNPSRSTAAPSPKSRNTRAPDARNGGGTCTLRR